jgi:hypothetical protein
MWDDNDKTRLQAAQNYVFTMHDENDDKTEKCLYLSELQMISKWRIWIAPTSRKWKLKILVCKPILGLFCLLLINVRVGTYSGAKCWRKHVEIREKIWVEGEHEVA